MGLLGHAGVPAMEDIRAEPGRFDRRRDRQAVAELAVGGGLVVVVIAAGVFFALRPGPMAVDDWILRVVTASRIWWFTSVTWLRYPVVVVAGALIAAVLTFRRDRPRAWACLIGPPLALITSELAAKPLVGRTLGGHLSYPSGSTVAAAALATVAVLATPPRLRPVTVVLASLYGLWMAVAVVALQWHLPTDALAGLAYGTGLVLVADGSAWMIAIGLRRRSVAHRPTVNGGADQSRSAAPPNPL